MPARDPRHIYEAICRKRAPETDAERTLFILLHGVEALNEAVPLRPFDPKKEELDPSVRYPFDIYETESLRFILEAFLLSTDDDAEIGDALGMQIDEVNVYRSLFFDTSVFRTDLEIMVFLQSIPEDHPYKPYYRIAFHQGVHALRWNFCRDKGTVDASTVVHTIMTDSFFRSIEHRGHAITNKQAKEAAKYARMALDCSRTLLNNTNLADQDIGSLRIRFEKVRQNRTVTDLTDGTKTQVLH